MLIEAGADVNAVDKSGQSCLSYAQHDTGMVELLITQGAVADAETIFAAIDPQNVEALKIILSKGTDPNMRRARASEETTEYNDSRRHQHPRPQSQTSRLSGLEPHEEYPLFHAGYHLDTARPGAGVNAHAEMHYSYTDLVQVLLDHGADPFAKFLLPQSCQISDAVEFETPSIDVPEGFRECTIAHELLRLETAIDSIFLCPSLDVNHRDARGCTMIHLAVYLDRVINSRQGETKGGNTERETVFDRLCSLGADIEALDNCERNVLHHMIGYNSLTRRCESLLSRP
jgi:ankyrin repeat protein